MSRIDRITELEIAQAVERQLLKLYVGSPSLTELPIAPLHGLPDLVQLEIALQRFAQIHRSKRSEELICAIRAVLAAARVRLKGGVGATDSPEARPHQAPPPDTPPAP